MDPTSFTLPAFAGAAAYPSDRETAPSSTCAAATTRVSIAAISAAAMTTSSSAAAGGAGATHPTLVHGVAGISLSAFVRPPSPPPIALACAGAGCASGSGAPAGSPTSARFRSRSNVFSFEETVYGSDGAGEADDGWSIREMSPLVHLTHEGLSLEEDEEGTLSSRLSGLSVGPSTATAAGGAEIPIPTSASAAATLSTSSVTEHPASSTQARDVRERLVTHRLRATVSEEFTTVVDATNPLSAPRLDTAAACVATSSSSEATSRIEASFSVINGHFNIIFTAFVYYLRMKISDKSDFPTFFDSFLSNTDPACRTVAGVATAWLAIPPVYHERAKAKLNAYRESLLSSFAILQIQRSVDTKLKEMEEILKNREVKLLSLTKKIDDLKLLFKKRDSYIREIAALNIGAVTPEKTARITMLSSQIASLNETILSKGGHDRLSRLALAAAELEAKISRLKEEIVANKVVKSETDEEAKPIWNARVTTVDTSLL